MFLLRIDNNKNSSKETITNGSRISLPPSTTRRRTNHHGDYSDVVMDFVFVALLFDVCCLKINKFLKFKMARRNRLFGARGKRGKSASVSKFSCRFLHVVAALVSHICTSIRETKMTRRNVRTIPRFLGEARR